MSLDSGETDEKRRWGLTEAEAVARRAHGRGNDFKLRASRSYFEIFRENIFTFFNIVLFSFALLLLLLGGPKDAFFTGVVALFNVMVATAQEVRAKRKLDKIALLAQPKATVIREGQEKVIDPGKVVLGDLLVAETGDQIIVDGIVLSNGHSELDESLLTGEADSVTKQPGDEVYSGSFVISGRIEYEANRVGSESLANKLTEGARKFTSEPTPLQKEINLIVRILLIAVLFFSLIIMLNYLIYKNVSLIQAVRDASVTFSLTPSSLFLMIVTGYALGALRIAKKGALVQRANSVESLCHVSVLCLDKTGTLTTNRIFLDKIRGTGELPDDELRQILGVYARSVSTGNKTSDAIATAYDGKPQLVTAEVPFSSERRWSAISFDDNHLDGTYVLGSPEILEPSLGRKLHPDLADLAREWADTGLRVLLFARREEITTLHYTDGQPQMPTNLVPLCLLSFRDELRPDARETLEEFVRAGVETKIISGDDPYTVSALAQQAGFGEKGKPNLVISGKELEQMDKAQFQQAAVDTAIFGRITPDLKKRLVQALRREGHYVAMIGDGVNDVLALKQANLGVAMQSGSQATRAVADILLLGDSFSALPEAFIEGQRIWNGMEDILRLYMTRIFSLTLLITMIAMLSAGFPLTPSQSSIIAMLTLALPAIALAQWARPGPLPDVSISRRLVRFVVPAMITITAASILIYLYFIVTTGDIAYAQLALTYTLIGTGLILVVFVEPPSEFWVGGDDLAGDWRPTLLALGLFVFFFVGLQIPPVRDFYGFSDLHQPLDYVVIIGTTVIWAFVQRFVWRARLVERYLGVDLSS
ncbi:MAG: HAD-IC family P-type ATPase [candidate division Zixibacteria bacterium]|nr:HAD-IC family P-type ATPase [candidate division Zixibacteria bacterium]NIW50166.1 HAD-IC family P-type ATPase [Gammaproteobacteria bacterium]NIR67870.1 HAD-IC family P-type ATPase [candidate division Zixibacteria bacterium]NIS49095.1 HAD-IC family P-type ATPase [candidate division Zixibacteria bacterium]NIU17182.1 HAD-IC family P-type ATPase [candidate division Zixibacteria bacterium]